MIRFDRTECTNFEDLKSREWLIANGLGGYASGTVAGANTRRYHGLLVANHPSGPGRLVLLSKLEDVLIVDGERFELSTNVYGEGVVHPQGHSYLVDFRLNPDPSFTYSNGRWTISKTIRMVSGKNTAVVEWALVGKGSASEVTLEVRPLVAFRDYHSTTHENQSLNPSVEHGEESLYIQPYASLPKLYLSHAGAHAQTEGRWYRNFTYDEERARGLDFNEDLFSPLSLSVDMGTRKTFTLVASLDPDAAAHASQGGLFKPVESSPAPGQGPHFGRTDLIPVLQKAAGQFVVSRPPLNSAIAGYHWFGEWGRDTMIALPGLLLSTDQPEIARDILLHYVKFVDKGMLPNRFPDAAESPEYNTVDATLWFFEAIRQYVYFKDSKEWRAQAVKLLREHLFEALQGIVRFHREGTRYGIHVDDKGFLWAGDAATQLTWMDAKVGDVAITPRYGRPVEIQALWYNALRTLADFASLLKESKAAAEYTECADRLRDNFIDVFWNEENACLFDVAGTSDRDPSIRPNQIFAVSLYYPLLVGKAAKCVLKVVKESLLTPVGLRTLAPNSPGYRGRYEGSVWDRDSSYHQGTVWPWLAGHFFAASLAQSESPGTTLDEIDAWLDEFSGHLRHAGLGQVSEIFDGDAPHTPRGCIAQAWSVSEILKLAIEVERRRGECAPSLVAATTAKPRTKKVA